MASSKENNQFPPLRRPLAEIADPGKVRLGDSTITAQFPPLRQPPAEIADPGRIRIGDSTITAVFPRRR
jgi:hypothetical protein